ncbi:DNA-binding transcriptional regulator [Methylophaga sp. 41_12_T18]|nr:DNA-binding transcriptional regulator [Methylophaga sp. 41_12_T18]
MSKSDRLFQLTNLLRAHQPVTAKQLADKMMLSERTIYRYIDDLSVSGIPVYGEPGVGYKLTEGFELPPLQLTSLELEALVLGVNLVTTRTGENLSQAAHSLLSKIEASIPSDHELKKTNESVALAPYNFYDERLRKNWDTVHGAIKDKTQLQLNYLSLDDQRSERNILPLGMFYWGGVWTLGAWCFLRLAYRNFRVDRIEDITVATDVVSVPEHVSLSDYIQLQKCHY